MTGFYEEDAKLTYDRAGVLVKRFLRKHKEHNTTATVVDVCNTMDVESSKHNEIRLREALQYFCDGQVDGGRRMRFEVPDEVPE
jgi:hypothetical protein